MVQYDMKGDNDPTVFFAKSWRKKHRIQQVNAQRQKERLSLVKSVHLDHFRYNYYCARVSSEKRTGGSMGTYQKI